MHSQVAANLMTDEMLMRSAQLTPEYRPLVDFHAQYSTVQSQKVHLRSENCQALRYEPQWLMNAELYIAM